VTVRFRRRSLLVPTRRAAALLALSAPVWLLSSLPGGTMLAAAATAAVVILIALDAMRTPSADDVRLERQIPRSAGIGDETEGAYVLSLMWPRKVTATLHDAMPAALGREGRITESIGLSPLRSTTVSFRFTPQKRGEHEPGPVVLRVMGPLGLMCRDLRFSPGDTLLVTPSLSGVRQYRLLALQHRLRDLGVRAVRRRGQGTSFANLREYAVGDDPRHIDWKATARRSRLITREYSVEQGQTIMIAVDSGRMMTQLAGGVPRFEHALSSALVLTDVAIHSRDQVGLIIFDDEVRAFVPPARDRAALENVRSALVVARASMVEPDYAMAFRTLEARHRKRSLIVLFTDVIDARSSQAIVAYTSRSVTRHLPLVVALRNDQLVNAALPVAAGSSTSLFESAAAEELVSAREGALQRMRRAGVSVLDVSPLKMTAAVVNRYIELKARASL
jgi:uncharacterized protein (DUF58 family)